MLEKQDYGHYLRGNLIIHWEPESDALDAEGFDKRNKESNGSYKQVVVLPKGTHLCRYGTDDGRYTSIKGTPYENLSLPYKKDTIEYHEYIVISDTTMVVKGKTAPMFNRRGGAVQFLHMRPIRDEIDAGILKEVC